MSDITNPVTLREAQAEAARSINARDAQTLLMHLLGRDRAWLIAHADREIYDDTLLQMRRLTRRRAAHEPLQYLTGTQEFFGLAFTVNPDVLIPRPETEHLVEAVELWATSQDAADTLHLIDVGTGSGAISVALATHVQGLRITAIDTSAAALRVARANARRHGCEDRITFREGDLLEGIPSSTADAVVSNPPYVPEGEAATMQPEVVGHEPHSALFAGPDGLDIYRRLIPAARRVLRPSGLLALEFGFGQRDALAALLAEGWSTPRFISDYAGIPRVAIAERT